MRIKRKLKLLMLICLLLCVVSACSKEEINDEIVIYSYDTLDEEEIVIENNSLELHFDPLTTHFYVVSKSTGYTWYSNPPDADNDPIAQGINKKELMATLSLKYNTESGTPTAMNNFGSSIEKGNYTYEVLDNGIKVQYTIADVDKVYIFPKAVPESRFNEFFLKLDKSAQSKVKMNFKVYDINKLGKKDDKDSLLATYPDLANERMYVLREGIQEYLKQEIEDYFASVGYTQEDYEKDSERYSTTTTSDKPMFNVSVQYELTENGILVSIPLKEIQYKSKYHLVELKPLGFFGAGGVDDQGFIIVPDGSGGLINFNNQKNRQSPYTSNLYGWDYGINRDAVIDETRINMPVFGISNKDASFICVLEQGSSYAYIDADISGRLNSYNAVGANYNLIHTEMMDISAKSDTTVRMFQKKLPDEMISQRYILLNDNTYPKMAVAYREYLLSRYDSLVKQTESKVPVAVEIIGAIDRTKHVLGVPVKRPYALTTYKQTRDITEQLLSYGIDDLRIKYNGWFNDGISHDAPNKVKLISELGSKKDFKNMVKFMDDNDVKLYLQATFQFVYNNSTFDDFLAIRDAAKLVNRELVELYPYHPVWFGEYKDMDMFYLAKPEYYLKNFDSYAKGIAKLGVKNIAFGDIGKTLSADYDDKKEVSREAALKLQQEKMAELKAQGYGMMIESGNLYAVPYADMIVDVNLATKGYNIIDEEIPFYEIALHGLVPYAGEAINLARDYNTNILRSAETGAGLYFIFMEADSFALQDSNYTKYFSSEFSRWTETTKELYTKAKNDFGHLYNQFIIDHKKIDKGVTLTEYEDGTKVIVNYQEKPYTYNQTVIPAKNYVVEGGGQ